ncbi:MAG: type 1 glutamine amidotransferase [Gammaproteobacteria bacterium]|nr:type 1 glutamine amidotransferase [Gammaproteobacteria bacterium]MCP4088246.1 type 1 glutamine amidotransferase [Gammaproteobacteria bacterium]MCP4276443.1 type 1 glutamine amidotransferase [Gammaproteobacteria bacterium]MCP4831090.1 type 1 glutamine amidotransferase [Gammaproteobacteria bacterium]MCP4929358.1 type 1 glutamine amidotransferase [Gammaproteobacteria bacterium]
MSEKKHKLKILLLQIRNQTQVRQEELASFIAYSGLQAHQFDVLNVFDTPEFNSNIIEGYDALFVGGASEASVLEPDTYNFVNPSIRLLQHCINNTFPVFASCFGFQLAILALGGTIIRDLADFEMGTPPILLTDEAASDTLFHDVADKFPAVSVHKERAIELPKQCQLLAYTEACIHAFKVINKPFWGFQFHPEVNRATLIERLTIFKNHYTDGDDHLEKVLQAALETPESNRLVKKFIDRVLLAKT